MSTNTTNVQNTGTNPMNWTATPDDPSVTVSPASGTVPSGGATTLTVTSVATGTAASGGSHTYHVVVAAVDAVTGLSAVNSPITYTVNETTTIVVASDAFNRASLNASRIAPDVSPAWTINAGITVVISGGVVSFSANSGPYGAVYIDTGGANQTADLIYSAVGAGVAILCLRMTDWRNFIGIYSNAGTLHAAIFDNTGPVTGLTATGSTSYTPIAGDKLIASINGSHIITVSYVRSGTTNALCTFDATPYASNTATNVGFSLDSGAANKISFFGATLP